MSIYVYEEDALEKMAKVEGDRWLREQQQNPDPFCSFQAFKDEWLRTVNHDEQQMKESGCIYVGGNVAIYGFEGWHRYFVKYDGRIEFSASHADHDEEVIQTVREAGFDIDQ